MPTDYKELLALFEEFGIDFTEDEDEGYISIYPDSLGGDSKQIVQFLFDKEGNYAEVIAMEDSDDF